MIGSRAVRRGRGDFASAPASLRPIWSVRLAGLARALGRPVPLAPGRSVTSADLVGALGRTVDVTDRSQVWLALAALSGTLAFEATVTDVARACEFDGPGALWDEVARSTTPAGARREVRVLVGATLADVNHTVATDLSTGIQRVARETSRRWLATTGCIPVAWTPGFGGLRELTAAELSRVTDDVAAAAGARGGTPGRPAADRREPAIIVPWRSTVLVPELAAEHGRSGRLLALASSSGNRTGVIGFDCVPLTSAETTAEGFASVFFGNLAAVRHFDRIAAISGAAAVEYEGWRQMLGAVGLAGPSIRRVSLPEEAPEATDDDLAEARTRFVVGELPLVLVVGSHEPRKNHLAVLHAAELRWRAGDEFTLTFIGGNSWAGDEFYRALAEAQRAGRPVESASRLPDRLLWAAYRIARFTVFPSLNEGFGLPVAESLAAGTPVITSSYGSMREIGEGGGALLVDPRDEHAIATGIARLLHDDALLESLVSETTLRNPRSWDEYADEVWQFLTGSSEPQL